MHGAMAAGGTGLHCLLPVAGPWETLRALLPLFIVICLGGGIAFAVFVALKGDK